MSYKYEQKKRTLMRRLLIYAAQDREGMICSLASGGEPSKHDKEYIAECEMMLRDIIRMDANLGFGIYTPGHVKGLERQAKPSPLQTDEQPRAPFSLRHE